MKKFKAAFRWGADEEVKENLCVYEFDSMPELDAFLKGVHEAVGWLDCEYVDVCDECGFELKYVTVPDSTGNGMHEEFECKNCVMSNEL